MFEIILKRKQISIQTKFIFFSSKPIIWSTEIECLKQL